jgi:hypothetical protein
VIAVGIIDREEMESTHQMEAPFQDQLGERYGVDQR